MKEIQLAFLLFLCCVQAFGIEESSIKICITSGFEQQCDQLDRESGKQVECIRVQDSVECAKILRHEKAGFGVFSADSMLLLATLNYDGLIALKELRHRERLNHTYDFEAVVIVKSNYEGGIKSLKGLKYCHPGFYYGRTERWSERFLKQFERAVVSHCDRTLDKTGSPAEIEVATVANYFGSSCRPGAWSNNPQEDQRLKAKYPQLCELCDSKTSPCEYTASNRHAGALNCLINQGQVAYVSLQDAQEFFSAYSGNAHLRDEYAYLCEDGTKQLISDESRKPCNWANQPWPAIAGTENNSVDLSQRLSKWAHSSYGWENAIREILSADSLIPTSTDLQSPRKVFYHLNNDREIPYQYPLCSTITWCTKSLEEKDKCEVIRAAGLTAGVYPLIECQDPVVFGTLGCLKAVDEGKADFTVIDSNYGYIARSEFNLTTVLYGETDTPAMAGVVIREDELVNYKYMQNISGVKACVNEYNGIASLAFIENGKKIDLFDMENCNHSQILSNFFGSSCVPGASDHQHNIYQTNNNLCTLCPQIRSHGAPSVDVPTRNLIPPDSVQLAQEINTKSNFENELDVLNSHPNCNADKSNEYYGDDGALLCLIQKRGDVAILGLKNLNDYAKDFTIDPKYYRVICQNGSVADYAGFDVDSDCALATYVDSEVVIKSNSTKREGIINALLSFDKYFRIDPDFKMYGTFDGYKNLLVNKGTVGWTVHDEKDLGPHIDSYNKLLKDVRECGNAGYTSTPIASIIIGIMLLSIALNRLRQ